jgi:hypothetical protein
MPPSLRSSGIRFAALTPAARPPRRSHRTARSRRRIGSARKANPRPLAPAELQARTTTKSKSHKRQAQPAQLREHRTRIKAKRWRVRCGGALTRVRSVQLFRQAGPETKATAKTEATRSAARCPAHDERALENWTLCDHRYPKREGKRERTHRPKMLWCECPQGHRDARWLASKGVDRTTIRYQQ